MYDLYSFGLLIKKIDHNTNYWLIVFCTFAYKGNPENSSYFYLHPKSKPLEKEKIYLSTSKKWKGHYYTLGPLGERYYIPQKFIHLININN